MYIVHCIFCIAYEWIVVLSILDKNICFKKGFLVNWDHQKTVWDHLFGKHSFNIQAYWFNYVSFKDKILTPEDEVYSRRRGGGWLLPSNDTF